MNWMMMPLKRFADFAGRSRRLEFWLFWALLLTAQLIATYIDRALDRDPVAAGMGIVALAVNLTLIIPAASVGVRRLHDTARSGWWMLLLGVPFVAFMVVPQNVVAAGALVIGALVVLVLTVQPGDVGSNAYGHDPKAGVAAPRSSV
jgi:uncharacterized membrane protein YhaH (DUF805 family)